MIRTRPSGCGWCGTRATVSTSIDRFLVVEQVSLVASDGLSFRTIHMQDRAGLAHAPFCPIISYP